MIDKLTKFVSIQYGPGGNLEVSDSETWINSNEVKELLSNQEKKTKILLDALEEIASFRHAGCAYDYCEGYCHVEAAREALEEYRKP